MVEVGKVWEKAGLGRFWQHWVAQAWECLDKELEVTLLNHATHKA